MQAKFITEYRKYLYGNKYMYYPGKKASKREAQRLEKNGIGCIRFMWLPFIHPRRGFVVPVIWQWVDNSLYLVDLREILETQYDFLFEVLREKEVKKAYINFYDLKTYSLIIQYLIKWKRNEQGITTNIASVHQSPTPPINHSPTPSVNNNENETIDEHDLAIQTAFANKEFKQILLCMAFKMRSKMSMPIYNRTTRPLSHGERMSVQVNNLAGKEHLTEMAQKSYYKNGYDFYDDIDYEKLAEFIGKEQIKKTVKKDGNTFTTTNINAKWKRDNIMLTISYWLAYTDGNGDIHTKAH